jgi:hypothetical protein
MRVGEAENEGEQKIAPNRSGATVYGSYDLMRQAVDRSSGEGRKRTGRNTTGNGRRKK